jgi:hypothetical protein
MGFASVPEPEPVVRVQTLDNGEEGVGAARPVCEIVTRLESRGVTRRGRVGAAREPEDNIALEGSEHGDDSRL